MPLGGEGNGSLEGAGSCGASPARAAPAPAARAVALDGDSPPTDPAPPAARAAPAVAARTPRSEFGRQSAFRRPGALPPRPDAAAGPVVSGRGGAAVAVPEAGPAMGQAAPAQPAPGPGTASVSSAEAAELLVSLESALAHGCRGAAPALRDRLRAFLSTAGPDATIEVSAAEIAEADEAVRCVEEAARSAALRRGLAIGAAGLGLLFLFL